MSNRRSNTVYSEVPNLVTFDDNDDINLGSLETAAIEAAVADGLITNSVNGSNKVNAKVKKTGLRRGKWTSEEENYSNRLIQEFKMGLLPLTDGTTLRTFLSKLLNCDPMRISKKFVGAKCIGKQVFRRRQVELDKLTPEQIENSRNELAELERRFLDRVAQTNRAKSVSDGGTPSQVESELMESVLRQSVSAAPWALTADSDLYHPPSSSDSGSSSNGHSQNGYSVNNRNGDGSGSKIPAQQYSYTQPPQHAMFSDGHKGLPETTSHSEMLEFQRLMANSNDALASLVNQPSQQQQQSYMYSGYPAASMYGADSTSSSSSAVSSSSYPRVSSLEVLCNVDAVGSDQFNGLYDRQSSGSNSFPWGMGSSPALNGRDSGVDSRNMSAINNSYSQLNPTDSSGGDSFPLGTVGEGRLPYSSSAEWPSMNNLVVAAETIEQLGSMNSLLGGGLMGSIASMGRLAQQGVSSSADADVKVREPSYFYPSEAPGENPHHRQDFVNFYRGPASLQSTSDSAPSSGRELKIGEQRQQVEDGDVGYPLDEDDAPVVRTNGSYGSNSGHSSTNNTAFSTGAKDTLTIFNPNNTVDDGFQAPAGVSQLGRIDSENTPISSILLRNDMLFMAPPAVSPAAGSSDALPQSVVGVVSQHVNGSDAARGASETSSTSERISVRSSAPHAMSKTSSVDNFWMLVGMGDIPQPDQGVLSTTLWQEDASSAHRHSYLSAPSSSFPEERMTPTSPSLLRHQHTTPDQLPPYLARTEPGPSVDSTSISTAGDSQSGVVGRNSAALKALHGRKGKNDRADDPVSSSVSRKKSKVTA